MDVPDLQLRGLGSLTIGTILISVSAAAVLPTSARNIPVLYITTFGTYGITVMMIKVILLLLMMMAVIGM